MKIKKLVKLMAKFIDIKNIALFAENIEDFAVKNKKKHKIHKK
jgi:hypothetical protein